MKRYDPKSIETKWQSYWDEQQLYKADLTSHKPKYIAMSMFNYPSGAGIHIGHAMNYTISDVQARFKRQQGYESYHPVGWDAFGLPAENYAIKSGVSPQQSMAKIIPDYHKQYKAMGWSNDWSKEIATHEPEYYRWTQWIFAQMFKQGLAYQDSRMQWWCAADNTVLANEQVIDGKCWRHDGPNDPLVEKKEVKQWFFKITEYADELLEATDALNWTESVKLAQKNWIGKSVGAEVDFKVQGSSEKITVFTTRADTIYGATFLVLAPEHHLVKNLVEAEYKDAADEYVRLAEKKSDVQRQEAKQKTGVFTGSYATNPLTKEKIPVWIADYVLIGYGTGAIMAVPAHDQRDYLFARHYDLPIRQTFAPIVIDEDHPPRNDKQDTTRTVTMSIVKHPTKDEIISLHWPELGWRTLITGGVEDGEDIILSAQREIQEETGYKSAKFVKKLPYVINSKFYAKHKDVNRDVMMHILYFELDNLDIVTVKKESHENFETNWVKFNKLSTLQPISELDHILKWLKEGDSAIDGEGVIIGSGPYDGMTTSDARERIIKDLQKKDIAKEVVNYKMRDWSVSRQRYWGAPIPIINCPSCGNVLVQDTALPVILPELKDFQPSGDGRSALARATEWLKVDCPKCGGPAERETDTLDTYICSSWYMLRYFDPYNTKQIFNSKIINKWMPVDFYNGGDHATAHMIYARFVTRFFHKLGLVDNPEPFKKFLFNGKVTAADGHMFSKSKGNGVDPLEIIGSGYGADALRTYLMFAAPLEVWAKWDPHGVPGTYRFLNRTWNLVMEFLEAKNNDAANQRPLNLAHKAAKKVTQDLENQKYNTAIATLMQCINELYLEKAENGFSSSASWQTSLEMITQLMAPFAPHIAEELWQQLGHKDSVNKDHWPRWDEKYLVSGAMSIIVQVNGKMRSQLSLPTETNEDEVVAAALADEKIKAFIGNQQIKRTVYVPQRIVNLVV